MIRTVHVLPSEPIYRGQRSCVASLGHKILLVDVYMYMQRSCFEQCAHHRYYTLRNGIGSSVKLTPFRVTILVCPEVDFLGA